MIAQPAVSRTIALVRSPKHGLVWTSRSSAPENVLPQNIALHIGLLGHVRHTGRFENNFRPMTGVHFFELAQGSLGIIWIPKKTSANQQPQVLGESWLAGLHVFFTGYWIVLVWSFCTWPSSNNPTAAVFDGQPILTWDCEKHVENISKALKWVKSCISAIIYTISIPAECQKNCWLVVSTFNPKNISQIGSFPQIFGVKIKTYFKPQPRFLLSWESKVPPPQ